MNRILLHQQGKHNPLLASKAIDVLIFLFFFDFEAKRKSFDLISQILFHMMNLSLFSQQQIRFPGNRARHLISVISQEFYSNPVRAGSHSGGKKFSSFCLKVLRRRRKGFCPVKQHFATLC